MFASPQCERLSISGPVMTSPFSNNRTINAVSFLFIFQSDQLSSCSWVRWEIVLFTCGTSADFFFVIRRLPRSTRYFKEHRTWIPQLFLFRCSLRISNISVFLTRGVCQSLFNQSIRHTHFPSIHSFYSFFFSCRDFLSTQRLMPRCKRGRL